LGVIRSKDLTMDFSKLKILDGSVFLTKFLIIENTNSMGFVSGLYGTL
jgi:hypothetical protein